MTPSIRPVTKDNWRALTKLKVREEQTHFVVSNAYSIAEARFVSDDENGHGQWYSYDFGIYENKIPVGYFLYQYNFDHPLMQAYILRLMVDEKYQGKGYSRFAIQWMLDVFRAEKHVKVVGIDYEPDNDLARQVYAKFGFRETGEIVDGEMLALLRLRE